MNLSAIVLDIAFSVSCKITVWVGCSCPCSQTSLPAKQPRASMYLRRDDLPHQAHAKSCRVQSGRAIRYLTLAFSTALWCQQSLNLTRHFAPCLNHRLVVSNLRCLSFTLFRSQPFLRERNRITVSISPRKIEMADSRRKDVGVNVVPSSDDHEYGQQASSSRTEEGDFVTRTEERDLSRGLHQRHVSLIAIAGAIVSASHEYCFNFQLTPTRRGLVFSSVSAALFKLLVLSVLCSVMLPSVWLSARYSLLWGRLLRFSLSPALLSVMRNSSSILLPASR